MLLLFLLRLVLLVGFGTTIFFVVLVLCVFSVSTGLEYLLDDLEDSFN